MGSGSSKKETATVSTETSSIKNESAQDINTPVPIQEPEPARPRSAWQVQPVPPTPREVPPPTASTLDSRKTRSAKEFCEFCRRNHSDGYCFDCGLLICGTCVEHHADAKLLKKHKMISLETYKDNIDMVHKYVKPINCQVHRGNEMTYYCNTCSIPICMHCAEYNHRKPQHQHKTLIAGLETKHRELAEQLSRAKDKRKELTDKKIRLNNIQAESDQHSDLLTVQIREHTDILVHRLKQLIEQLENNCDSLVKHVDLTRQKKQRGIEDKNDGYDNFIREIDTEREEATNIREHSNDIGFLLGVNKSIHQLKVLANTRVSKYENKQLVFMPNDTIIEADAVTTVGSLSNEYITQSNNKTPTRYEFPLNQREETPLPRHESRLTVRSTQSERQPTSRSNHKTNAWQVLPQEKQVRSPSPRFQSAQTIHSDRGSAVGHKMNGWPEKPREDVESPAPDISSHKEENSAFGAKESDVFHRQNISERLSSKSQHRSRSEW
ncbi:uncharacterized protein LOC144349498 [Saccoglossus kowalevskii]